jgi:hypothetical protein
LCFGSPQATGRLTSDELGRFRRDGYLVVEDVLDVDLDIAPVLAEYERRLDGLISLLVERAELAPAQARELADQPFPARLTSVWLETRRDYAQWFDITLPPAGVRADTPIHLGPAVFALLSSPRLLDVVESILGPEIYANPVQHIRMKLPRRATVGVTRSDLGAPRTITASVPWHQDNGVYETEADGTDILTVWLPLNEATVENGCLQVIPGSHGDLVAHCVVEGIAGIPDTLLPAARPIPLPMRPGGLLLMDKRTIHGALDNQAADQVRLSFDLRYGRPGEPTGRTVLDAGGFIARSRVAPAAVLEDPVEWADRWLDLRARMVDADAGAGERWAAPRWDSTAEWCA